MQRALILFRFIALVLFLGFPFAAFGFFFRGKPGLAVGFGLAVLILALAGIWVERFVARSYRASRKVPAGLVQSLRFSDPSGQLTRIAVFPDPSPNAVMARSWTGTGTIFISRGLLVLLSEEELRSVLKVCRERMGRADIVLRGICAVLGSLLFSVAPHSWVQVLLGGQRLPVEARGQGRPSSRTYSVIHFCAFLVVYPVASTILWIGGGLSCDEKGMSFQTSGNPTLKDAMRKIKAVAQSWPLVDHPALTSLYLYPCIRRSSLLPLS